ncbi:MAG: DUF362 domain-containing protein, partial [Chloroflexota bacterium]
AAIAVRTDACAACAWQAPGEQVRRQAAQANTLLPAWGRPGQVTCMDALDQPVERVLWQVGNPPLSRRDLFRMLGRQGQTAMARAMNQDAARKGAAPGRDRQRMLAAVAHYPDPQPSGSLQLDGLDFAGLAVSEACTACGACARACPTAALRYTEDENKQSFSLAFTPQHCIACQACLGVCAPQAIRIDLAPAVEQVFCADPLTLQTGGLAACARCGSAFAARAGLRYCPQCEFRRQNPFGVRLPPGFVLDGAGGLKRLPPAHSEPPHP